MIRKGFLFICSNQVPPSMLQPGSSNHNIVVSFRQMTLRSFFFWWGGHPSRIHPSNPTKKQRHTTHDDEYARENTHNTVFLPDFLSQLHSNMDISRWSSDRTWEHPWCLLLIIKLESWWRFITKSVSKIGFSPRCATKCLYHQQPSLIEQVHAHKWMEWVQEPDHKEGTTLNLLASIQAANFTQRWPRGKVGGFANLGHNKCIMIRIQN